MSASQGTTACSCSTWNAFVELREKYARLVAEQKARNAKVRSAVAKLVEDKSAAEADCVEIAELALYLEEQLENQANAGTDGTLPLEVSAETEHERVARRARIEEIIAAGSGLRTQLRDVERRLQETRKEAEEATEEVKRLRGVSQQQLAEATKKIARMQNDRNVAVKASEAATKAAEAHRAALVSAMSRADAQIVQLQAEAMEAKQAVASMEKEATGAVENAEVNLIIAEKELRQATETIVTERRDAREAVEQLRQTCATLTTQLAKATEEASNAAYALQCAKSDQDAAEARANATDVLIEEARRNAADMRTLKEKLRMADADAVVAMHEHEAALARETRRHKEAEAELKASEAAAAAAKIEPLAEKVATQKRWLERAENENAELRSRDDERERLLENVRMEKSKAEQDVHVYEQQLLQLEERVGALVEEKIDLTMEVSKLNEFIGFQSSGHASIVNMLSSNRRF